jgi:hypothetical protein
VRRTIVGMGRPESSSIVTDGKPRIVHVWLPMLRKPYRQEIVRGPMPGWGLPHARNDQTAQLGQRESDSGRCNPHEFRLPLPRDLDCTGRCSNSRKAAAWCSLWLVTALRGTERVSVGDYLKGTVTGPGTLEKTAMKSRSSGVR